VIETNPGGKHSGMKEPTQEKKQKEGQRGRRMGNLFIYPKKIGQTVDQRKEKNKNQNPRFHAYASRHKNQQKHGYQSNLERFK
jgi:hypothetical protein